MRDTLSAATVEIPYRVVERGGPEWGAFVDWWVHRTEPLSVHATLSREVPMDRWVYRYRFEGSHADVQSFLRVAVPLSRS